MRELARVRTSRRHRRAPARCARPGAHALRARVRASPRAARASRAAAVRRRRATARECRRASAETIEASPAVSLTAVRSASASPTNGARRTASHATRSSGDSSARASASRSRTTVTSASGSSFTPMNGTAAFASASRTARRCGRALASTAILSAASRALELRDEIGNRRGFGARTVVAFDAMDLRHALELGSRRRRWPGAHGALAHIVRDGKHAREDFVAPVDQGRRRAEIAPQFERLERQSGEPGGAHRREAADLRVAKAVDGLHRIADQEQRAPVAGRPVLRERAQQFVLIARGVLEFVDEDVHEPRAEAFGQRRRAAVLGQRPARGAGDLGVIAFAVRVEQARQLRSRVQQQTRERVERAACAFGHLRIGQRGDRRPAPPAGS